MFGRQRRVFSHPFFLRTAIYSFVLPALLAAAYKHYLIPHNQPPRYFNKVFFVSLSNTQTPHTYTHCKKMSSPSASSSLKRKCSFEDDHSDVESKCSTNGSPSKRVRVVQSTPGESTSHQLIPIHPGTEGDNEAEELEVTFQIAPREDKGKQREEEWEAEAKELREKITRLEEVSLLRHPIPVYTLIIYDQESRLYQSVIDRVHQSVQCSICHDVLRNPQVYVVYFELFSVF